MKHQVLPLFIILILLSGCIINATIPPENTDQYNTIEVSNIQIKYLSIDRTTDEYLEQQVKTTIESIIKTTTLINVITESKNNETDIVNYIFTFQTGKGEIIKSYNISKEHKKIAVVSKEQMIEYLPLINDQLSKNKINQSDYNFINYIINLNDEKITFIIPQAIIKENNIHITTPIGKFSLENIQEKQEASKQIAITFDDAPSKRTKELVDLLEKLDVVATFFVLGTNVLGREENLRYIFAHGHEIGNHAYSHLPLSQLSYYQVQKEVQKTQNLVYQATLSYPKVFRLPYGAYTKQTLYAINLPIVQWNCDSRDWVAHEDYVNNVMKNVKNNAIILFHDFSYLRVEAIEEVIINLKNEDYQFVTASEIIGYTSSEKAIYHKLHLEGIFK